MVLVARTIASTNPHPHMRTVLHYVHRLAIDIVEHLHFVPSLQPYYMATGPSHNLAAYLAEHHDQMSGCMRHVWSRKTPRDGSTVADSPRRWPRAQTPAPGGWTPWMG